MNRSVPCHGDTQLIFSEISHKIIDNQMKFQNTQKFTKGPIKMYKEVYLKS